jgi:small subunit ribosomal protein S18
MARNNDGIKPSLHRQLFKRRKSCPFCEKGAPSIDYKDTKVLQKYLSERGRVVPRRISFVSSEHQRELAAAIKRARHLALLPYVVK